MPSPLAHFAINADDVSVSRSFYESVFGWTFQAWGPPGFYTVDTGGGVEGALQQRRPIGGRQINAVEATFAVDDVDEVAVAVVAAGGSVVMPRHTIAGVGHLIFLTDPAGNTVGAMQYDECAT